MYPLFRDVAGPYQRTLWVKYVLYTHVITFIIKSNWKLSQNLHTWTTQYVHFQSGIYSLKPVVLASSSTFMYSKWNILSGLFVSYTKTSTGRLVITLSSVITWLQDTYGVCMKEDLLDNILHISVTVATQIQSFLLNKYCTICLFIKGSLTI